MVHSLWVVPSTRSRQARLVQDAPAQLVHRAKSSTTCGNSSLASGIFDTCKSVSFRKYFVELSKSWYGGKYRPHDDQTQQTNRTHKTHPVYTAHRTHREDDVHFDVYSATLLRSVRFTAPLRSCSGWQASFSPSSYRSSWSMPLFRFHLTLGNKMLSPISCRVHNGASGCFLGSIE